MNNQNLYKLCSEYDNLSDLKIEGVVRKIDKLYHKEIVVEFAKGNNNSFFAPQDLRFSFKEKSMGLKKLKPFQTVNSFIKDNRFEKRKESYKKILNQKFLDSRIDKLLLFWKLSDKKGILEKFNKKLTIFDEEFLQNWQFFQNYEHTDFTRLESFQYNLAQLKIKSQNKANTKNKIPYSLFIGNDKKHLFFFNLGKVYKIEKKKLLNSKYKKYKSTRIKSGDFMTQLNHFDGKKFN